jgi:hypothetical protein
MMRHAAKYEHQRKPFLASPLSNNIFPFPAMPQAVTQGGFDNLFDNFVSRTGRPRNYFTVYYLMFIFLTCDKEPMLKLTLNLILWQSCFKMST